MEKSLDLCAVSDEGRANGQAASGMLAKEDGLMSHSAMVIELVCLAPLAIEGVRASFLPASSGGNWAAVKIPTPSAIGISKRIELFICGRKGILVE